MAVVDCCAMIKRCNPLDPTQMAYQIATGAGDSIHVTTDDLTVPYTGSTAGWIECTTNSVHEVARLEPIQGVDNAPRIEAAVLEEFTKNPIEYGKWDIWQGGGRTIRGGACLILCPGEWTLRSPIKLPSGLTLDLYGAHMVMEHTGNMFEIHHGVHHGVDQYTLDSVEIHGHCNAQLHGEAVGSTAISLDTVSRCSFNNLVIENFNGPAINAVQSIFNHFSRLHIANNEIGADLGRRTTLAGQGHHSNRWEFCQFLGSRQNHILCEGSMDSTVFDTCDFEECPGEGIVLRTLAAGDRIRGNKFDGCHLEQNLVHVRLDKISGTMIGNSFLGGMWATAVPSSVVTPQTHRLIVNNGDATTIGYIGMENDPTNATTGPTTTGVNVQALFEQQSNKGDLTAFNVFGPWDGGAQNVPYATNENGVLYPESLETYGTTTVNPRFRIIRMDQGFGPNEKNI